MSKPRGTNCSLKRAHVSVTVFIILFTVSLGVRSATAESRDTNSIVPNKTPGNVACREDIASRHRDELAGSLRKISGWPDLEFDSEGILRRGSEMPVGGSKTARELLAHVFLGTNAIVLEDVSRSSDVVFMRVVPAKWKTAVGYSRPAFVVQIDFADFDQVMGDELALRAFDLGWGLLHELDHIAHNSQDAVKIGETGECEARINQMRSECNLPQRIDYFYTLSPLTRETTFSTKLVRLAFEQPQLGKKKKRRYWVVWDANLVGGNDLHKQIAAL